MKKGKGLDSLKSDEIETLIQQSRTEISLLEKDNERKQERFDSLMKEGAKTSGSKRIQIAQDLETLERDIKSNELEIRNHSENIELMMKVKESKTARSSSSIDSILANTRTEVIKNEILSRKTKRKVTQRKTNELLNTVRDLQDDDENDINIKGNKYMEMFKEMDRNDSSLKPINLVKESEKKDEKSKGDESQKNEG
jgi:hypothetical protein